MGNYERSLSGTKKKLETNHEQEQQFDGFTNTNEIFLALELISMVRHQELDILILVIHSI